MGVAFLRGKAPLSGELSPKVTERLLQILQLPVVSDGHIFSLAREKIWKKRVLGDAGCFLPLNSGRDQCFGLAFHSGLTSRASWYAPPDTEVLNL